MAARTANSRARPALLVSSRLATLAQAISRTKPTAPKSIQRMGRTSATSLSCSGTRRSAAPAPESRLSGLAATYCRFKTPASARACSRVASGRSRANPFSVVTNGQKRAGTADVSAGRVTHTSRFGTGNSKPAGKTPTMAHGTALRMAVLPASFGSAAKRRFHNPELIMTTGGPPAVSSSGMKTRPSSGRTPRTSRKFAETRAPLSISGSPPPESAISSVKREKTPIPAKDRAVLRVSS